MLLRCPFSICYYWPYSRMSLPSSVFPSVSSEGNKLPIILRNRFWAHRPRLPGRGQAHDFTNIALLPSMCSIIKMMNVGNLSGSAPVVRPLLRFISTLDQVFFSFLCSVLHFSVRFQKFCSKKFEFCWNASSRLIVEIDKQSYRRKWQKEYEGILLVEAGACNGQKR